MKNITLFFMLTIMFAGTMFGQNESVAIYTDDQSKKGYADVAGDYLVNAIVKRGNYTVNERTAKFLEMINKEHAYGRSGAVDESTIVTIGKQLKVDLVCAVRIYTLESVMYITAKMISMEKASVTLTARPRQFKGTGDFEEACDAVIASMFGERGSSSGAKVNSPSTSTKGGKANGQTYDFDGIEMVFVEGTGSGILATPSFYIGKYEVTQAQWQAVMGNNPSKFGGSNCPVENVSWNEVQEFIKKLNKMTNKNFRLPTEKEWEYAAQEGNRKSNYEYSGSNTIGEVAWYIDNSSSRTHQVGTKKPNALGIYDMSGNVWEWCQDCYDSSCSTRVNRGGSWNYYAAICRVSNRYGNCPEFHYNNLGFRLALSE